MAANQNSETKGGKPTNIEDKSLVPAQTEDKAVKATEGKADDGKVQIVVAHPLAPSDLGLGEDALEKDQTMIRPGTEVGVEPHIAARFTGNGFARRA